MSSNYYYPQDPITYGDILFIFVIIVLVVLAIYWEWFDYDRLFKIQNIDTFPPEEQAAQLRFLACWNYENGPQWRSILVGTIIVGLLLWWIFGCARSVKLGFLILLIIFIVFYCIYSLRSYHIQRLLCSKATPGTGFAM